LTITIKLSTHPATAAEARASAASLGVEVSPAHPGTRDPELASWYIGTSAGDEQAGLLPAALDAQLARLERRDERDVFRQDAEHTVRTGRDDHVHALLLEDDPVGGDEFKVQCGHNVPLPRPLPSKGGVTR